MAFIDEIKAKAKADMKTIVLPESMDKRTFEAAEKILKEGIANLIIIGTPEEIEKNGAGFDLTGATIVDPFNDPNKQKYLDKFIELRGVDTMVAAAKAKAEKKGLSAEETEAAVEAAKKKGITSEKAQQMMESDYMYYACLMCKCGDADGAVSGACHSTGNTIRPALQLLKMKKGVSSVSGFFLMEVPDCGLGENGLFVFADCAVNTDFDSPKLAEIAKVSAESFEQFVGKPAKVAMLSYSTMGSAKHDDVTKVAEAVKIAHEKYPELTVDGELQLDAALVESVGALKAPDSKVAGHANTLVFPSLEAGNIGYKLVQRLAKANAYGPILQGLSMPVNDLSRGCYADDIVGTVAMTAVQAQAYDA
ncbi:MAG: phosphate acetyltransferase [Clostridiales bacterium]|nr:phosphate acetyltransferase [Clostridiales bacterium]